MNARWSVVLAAVVILAIPLLGCENSTSTDGPSDMDRMAAMLDQPKEQPSAEQVPPPVEVADEQPDDGMSQARAVTARDPTRGKKTRRTGGYMGAVLSTRFYAEHKMEFIKVEKALSLYNGDHGHYPKSHDEFMKEIIEPNYIHLPELDEGWEYIYDSAEPDLEQQLKIRPIPDEGADTEPMMPEP